MLCKGCRAQHIRSSVVMSCKLPLYSRSTALFRLTLRQDECTLEERELRAFFYLPALQSKVRKAIDYRKRSYSYTHKEYGLISPRFRSNSILYVILQKLVAVPIQSDTNSITLATFLGARQDEHKDTTHKFCYDGRIQSV